MDDCVHNGMTGIYYDTNNTHKWSYSMTIYYSSLHILLLPFIYKLYSAWDVSTVDECRKFRFSEKTEQKWIKLKIQRKIWMSNVWWWWWWMTQHSQTYYYSRCDYCVTQLYYSLLKRTTENFSLKYCICIIYLILLYFLILLQL